MRIRAPVLIDSRGRPSATLPMVWVALLAVLVRMLAPLWANVPSWDGLTTAAALGAVGAIWRWREGAQQ